VVGSLEAKLAAFDRQIDSNVQGVVVAVRAAVPLMSDDWRIVSIGTTSAHIPFTGAAGLLADIAAAVAFLAGPDAGYIAGDTARRQRSASREQSNATNDILP
jgi:3-oxoacyl-[acyl-carrier protein] reductase